VVAGSPAAAGQHGYQAIGASLGCL
jgi:hypothetical protein